jgi:hypothetical protein
MAIICLFRESRYARACFDFKKAPRRSKITAIPIKHRIKFRNKGDKLWQLA